MLRESEREREREEMKMRLRKKTEKYISIKAVFSTTYNVSF